MSHRIARFVLTFAFVAANILAAGITGIWSGQQQGRRGEPEDVSFRFKVEGDALTGKIFGDEFDIPIAEASLTGDQIRFAVTTINYYNRTESKFVYSGTVKGVEMELIRERIQTPEEKTANRPPMKQTIKLKRLT